MNKLNNKISVNKWSGIPIIYYLQVFFKMQPTVEIVKIYHIHIIELFEYVLD